MQRNIFENTRQWRLFIEAIPYVGREETSEYQHLLYGIELGDLRNRSYTKGPPFSFLPEYKNPCWLERLQAQYMTEHVNHSFHDPNNIKARKLYPIYKERLQRDSYPWRFRCLPYFYLAGVTKSGTTDFINMLLRHPQLHGPLVKEPMYWNRRRYPNGVQVGNGTYIGRGTKIEHFPFNSYLALLDYSAHLLNTTNDGRLHLIGDSSSYLFWEDNGWPSHPGNKGLTVPGYTTAMALHTAQPDAKLIVLLRNPTERASLYSEHLNEWLKIFQRKQLLIIKSEDYYRDRMKILEGTFSFLNISDIGNETRSWIERQPPIFKSVYSPMLAKTRNVLDSFFRPFNRRLEDLLHRQLW
ncbi:hypothetical protein LSH36_810g01048 [Paralvinella palmiformis]|uniref:Sulfotransferase n=1 Tax=Paralvinella palmiformis TaxID=53620 RepID=A0AAD9J056_9ANNE|nr:hypothetical protein LSH36_810g01048 [Paralvinella palmiformis]